MNLKTLIQFSLLLTIVATGLIFYKLFFVDPNKKLKNVKKDESDNKTLVEEDSNQIKDIVYKSNYLDDNRYVIKAEFGEFTKNNSDIMLLTNVTGTIFLENSEVINISSKKAKYNNINYNTNFYQDVLVTFDDHQINSDNFELFFDKKISTMYNNVIYKNLTTTLHADKVDIDLITKDSSIYMINKLEKVIIKNLN